ncbi:prolipoprotein diacylglyceryl transferase [Oscillatoria amoena NRMC-F 0135]|nr:prolipoprotein diacylglyceryl transferase [Oscillatoria amoena NRMC-F 0135]
MHPILFDFGSLKIYTYGFMIAVGVVFGVAYLVIQGKKEVKLTFDQANNLFLLIFAAAFIGGKVFLFFEDPSRYAHNLKQLFTGSGFVFYGSFLFAVPAMLWFFKRNKLPVYPMLDIMAIVTCLVHLFGRVGCFMAGCCYGLPTASSFGVTFTNPACQAKPLNTPLYPTQLMEAGFILLVMIFLLWIRARKQFYGQLFLLYLMLYATGRFVLEYFRGDSSRGYIIEGYISNSQAVALAILGCSLWFYSRWKKLHVIRQGR